MKSQIHIPEEWQMLVICLRCAIHDHPVPSALQNITWATLLRQARQHRVEHFLFPWLAKNFPHLFSATAVVPPDSAPAAWRALALEHLTATIIRQRQTTELLKAFADNALDLIPLKGTWLSENIYDEPSQRSMADIDILVHKYDIERAHTILTAAGYHAQRELVENVHICDVAYYHPAFKAFVELHWNVESEMSGALQIPKIDKIWQRTQSVTLFNQPVKALSSEDLLTHLVQHILHHQFALSLRSYVDIALLMRSTGERLNKITMEDVAADWKTGEAVPFILNLVDCMFEIDLPKQCQAHSADASMLGAAITALFELPEAHARTHEQSLLQYSKASAAGKIKIILERIFMRQSFMQVHYPFAKNRLLLPVAWMMRALALVRHTGGELRSATAANPKLQNAAIRKDIVRKLTETTCGS